MATRDGQGRTAVCSNALSRYSRTRIEENHRKSYSKDIQEPAECFPTEVINS
jgi:hypothetical protein